MTRNGIIIIIVQSLLLCCFSFVISLGILRPAWEFLEHNPGNSRKAEWQHWGYFITYLLHKRWFGRFTEFVYIYTKCV